MTRASFALSLLLALAAPLAAQPTVADDQLPFKEGPNGEKIPLFMHDQSMNVTGGFGWARDDVELEAVWGVTCLTPRQIHDLVLAGNQRLYRRVRRQPLMDAFSTGYPVDEIPWDGDRHRVREGQVPFEGGGPAIEPYVWLKVESGRFEIDDESGVRRVSLGTDLMDDIYFDTDDFLCLSQDLTIRARKRWDSETELRRLLIAIKQDSGVDEFGIKRPLKTDIRTDSADAAEIDALDESVMRGRDSWSGNDTPAIPLRRVWSMLKDRNLLPSSPTYKNALALKPKAFLRSVRSRYHLNECSLQEVRAFYDRGKTRLEALAAAAREARQQNAVPAARVAEVQAFEDKVRRVLDGSLVAERASAALAQLGVTNAAAVITSLSPGSTGPGTSTGLPDLVAREPLIKQRRVVAEAVNALYHELATDLDDGSDQSLRRVICRSLDRALDDHVEWFQAWQISKTADMRKFTTWDPFVTAHGTLVGNATALAEYNAYGEQQRTSGNNDFEDFAALDQARFDELRFPLRNEQARIWIRQIEAAGSAAKGLWFDEARMFYVPESDRAWGNFLIDTYDFTRMYSADVWDGVPIPDRRPSFDLSQPPYVDKLVGAALVAELQIELEVGTEYFTRLKQLRSIIALPRMFMRWASATNQANDPAGYAALYESLKAITNDDELLAKLAPFEDWLKAQGSVVRNLSAQEFRSWLEPARLTVQIRDDASYTEPAIEAALAGARFVFDQYVGIMSFVARLKGERTLEELDDAGAPNCIRWEPVTMAKGTAALTAIRGTTPPPGGGGGGLIGAISGNQTVDTAAAVEKKAYPGQKIEGTEVDYYKHDLQPGQSVTFTVKLKHQDGDLDMRLERKSTTQPGVMRRIGLSESSTDEERITFTAPATGTEPLTVYLRVYGWNGATGGYDLTVQ